MQSRWIFEFTLIAHAPPGDTQRDPRKCDREEKKRESDPVQQKNDFGTYVVFASALKTGTDLPFTSLQLFPFLCVK